jgi:hypothetical protein
MVAVRAILGGLAGGGQNAVFALHRDIESDRHERRHGERAWCK